MKVELLSSRLRLATLFAALLLLSCAEGQGMNEITIIADSVAKTISLRPQTTCRESCDDKVDLSKLLDFEWDGLYVYGPYTLMETVQSDIGKVTPDVENAGIEARDDISLLVFVWHGQVAKVVPYPREKGDFSRVGYRGPISKRDAVFNVVEDPDEQGWIYMELARRQ